jgi:hypothetical protein
MKTSFRLFIVSMLMLSCTSTKSLFQSGQYDLAIDYGIAQLQRKPGDGKTLFMVAESYRLANEQDFQSIVDFERRTDDPRRWESIHNIYRRLEGRQGKVRRIPRAPNALLQDDLFEFRDYSLNLEESKNRAVVDLYEAAVKLMESGNREENRLAYDKLKSVYGMNRNYKNVETLMEEARIAGTTFVVINIAPSPGVAIPVRVEQEIARLNVNGLNREWTVYHVGNSFNTQYHYFIEVEINRLTVSPERINQRTITESANIEDGWEYRKNPDGSVARDTSGNKIKDPVFREVKATVTILDQVRSAQLGAMLRVLNSQGTPVVPERVVTGDYNWTNSYATSKGDSRALSKNTRELMNKQKQAFPDVEIMLLEAVVPFRNQLQARINEFRSAIK